MKLRLVAKLSNGSKRELVVLEKHSDDNDWTRHRVLHRGRLNVGDELFVDEHILAVHKIIGGGIAEIVSEVDLVKLTDEHGAPPLPPYMKRDATPDDIERYQTVFARDPGSAAAPTASLNMTENLLKKLRDKGVIIKYITLHVGLGTFLPVRTEDVEDHDIHSEYFIAPADTIAAISRAKVDGKRVVALGTTVARTLEYIASCHSDPGLDPGEESQILRFTPQDDKECDIVGEADIYIYPGYEFKCIDALVTNFHAPGSTVLLLTAAFAGWDKLKNTYNHAVDNGYKFLSYGESMLII